MFSKKQINLLVSAIIILISAVAIVLSDNSSKLSPSFKNESISSTPESLYEEEVLGQSLLSSGVPVLPTAPDKIAEEDSDNQESEQVDEAGYRVVKIVDGDTLDVEIDGKIERLRLIGIDTPETVDPRKSVKCYGREASNKAKELLEGQFVSLESDETQGERDKYKRLLRYVFLADGTNFNLYMIAEGYAHEYTYANPYKYQVEFRQAEIDARENSRGLWNPQVCPN
ncbi:MAG: thermonuclease family protein [Candidatus Levybacteria bacterium]|nr:thermonuclease family protein [Candidatus Levybacteria bacterium]